jgi:drug/metabolite transporter (DMT)-like permease
VNPAASRPSAIKLALAFACIYVIWGSTYLAIRFAIETIPPLLMAGTRFLTAGILLYAWTLLRGEARRLTRAQWGAAALLGTLFFLGGNGGVSWAEQRVPSGVTALMVATVPFWIVIIDSLRRGGKRPPARVLLGVFAGLAGVALLVAAGGEVSGAIDPLGAAVIMAATLSWSFGTVLSRHLAHPASHLQSGAIQMLAGGVALCLAGLGAGEAALVRLDAVSGRSFLSFLYLTLAGSIVAFSAYNWLLTATTPARVGTYAFVNPVVAVLLGWALAGESVGPTMLIAGGFILVGVILIITARAREERAVPRASVPGPPAASRVPVPPPSPPERPGRSARATSHPRD